MSISSIVRALVAAKATPEQILAAVEAAEAGHEDALEQSRAKTRARVQAWRDRKAGNVTERNETLRNGSREGVTRVEDISSTNKISGEERKQDAPKARAGDDLAAFKAELSDLDPEPLEAFVKHRRSKRAALTGYAAKLFRQDCTACSMSLSQGVDTAISRGWITVKPEYFQGRQRQAQGPPPKQTVGQQARDELKRMGLRNAPDEITRHESGGNGSPDFAGSGIARRIAFSPGGRGGH